ARVQNHVELVGNVRQHNGEALEGSGAAGVLGDFIQGQVRHQQTTDNQQHHLDNIGQGHGLKAAVNGVGNRESRQEHHPVNQVQAGDGVDGQSAQPENGSQVDEGVQGQPEDGHDGAHPVVVTLLQKLGHGGDALLEEDGQEVLAHNQQGDG